MFNWLKPKSKQPGRLAKLLSDYPPYVPKHIGLNGCDPGVIGSVLSLQQCRENLDQYIGSMAERIATLKTLLAKLQIKAEDAYENPLVYVTALHRTLLAELPPLYRPEFRDYKVRDLSNRAGSDIVLSFMSDLAMLDIDVALKSKPGCFVGLNLDPTDSEMTFWRRPCLLGLTDRLFQNFAEIFCVEESYFGYYANMDRPSRLTHPDAIVPATYSDTIGGWMLIRLDRYIVHPDLDELKRTTWLGEAA